jgi:hypothetical protein
VERKYVICRRRIDMLVRWPYPGEDDHPERLGEATTPAGRAATLLRA